VTFLSKTTINTIIHIILQIIQNEIRKQIQDATFFSILIDSSQDISVTDQLALCIRYVTGVMTIKMFFNNIFGGL